MTQKMNWRHLVIFIVSSLLVAGLMLSKITRNNEPEKTHQQSSE